MKTNNKKEKDFDAVKMMREIRNKINNETKGMSFVELRNYSDSKLADKNKSVSPIA